MTGHFVNNLTGFNTSHRQTLLTLALLCEVSTTFGFILRGILPLSLKTHQTLQLQAALCVIHTNLRIHLMAESVE